MTRLINFGGAAEIASFKNPSGEVVIVEYGGEDLPYVVGVWRRDEAEKGVQSFAYLEEDAATKFFAVIVAWLVQDAWGHCIAVG